MLNDFLKLLSQMKENSINDCDILELVISFSGSYSDDMSHALKILDRPMIDSEHVVRPVTG